MGGGGKSQTTTQQVSIPPEVLARYNAVNARAETVAATPFQKYGTTADTFVAPLTQSQQQGIAQTQQYAQSAQPGFQQAQSTLQNAYQQGYGQTQAAYKPLQQGYETGQQMYGQAKDIYGQAAGAAQPYFSQAEQGLAGGLGYAQNLQQQAYDQAQLAPGAAAPLQGYAGERITGAAGQAAPANAAAMQLGLGAGAAAAPYYGYATEGTQGAVQAGQGYLAGATGDIAGAAGRASPYYETATAGTQAALDVASPYFQAATQGLGAAQAQASPYFDAATAGTTAALRAGQPYGNLATQAAMAGSQAVRPDQFSQQAIGQYMSPFMSNVVAQTMAAQAQQNAQQRQALTGDAIRAGAFGGDRAGIAQANLAYQQNLANQQTIANLLQGGYGQALGAFQQQQGVNLAAEQANRAAQQQLAQQALSIGQQGYGQNLGAAQQMAALGSTQFQQGLSAAQTMANLGQNLYGQRLGAAQQMAGLGQALYGQGITSGQALAGLGQQAYGQQMGAAQQMAGLGKDIFGQDISQAQTLSQLGQTQFGQNIAGGQAAQQLAQQQYAQQMANAQFAQGLGAQGFQQNLAAAQQRQQLGQAQAGLQFQTGQAIQGLGAAGAQLGQTTAAQQAALAQQGYGMGATTAQLGGSLAAQQQAAALQGAQALLGAGQIQQQTEQAGKQALYNQFLQEQGYPFQVAQFLGNLAMGTGALSGSTTTTTQPSAVFSDRRLKEDIRKVGETDEGLPIYKFRYKGEDKDETHIGYMAQDVEKKHPDAVGEYGGAKYVDYDKVNARESMGGAVHGEGLGRAAYALGGNSPIDPNDIQALIAQQRQMYGPHGMGGLYGGSPGESPRGGKAAIPTGGLHVPKLVTAGGLPRQQQSGMDQAMAAAEKAKGYAESIFGKLDPKTGKRVGGLDDQAKSFTDWLTKSSDKKENASQQQASQPSSQQPPAQPKAADQTASLVDPDTGRIIEDTVYSARGGVIPRQHFKFGGEDMYKSEQSYVPEEVLESDDKKPELMTAKGGTGGGGGGGKSGLGTALGAAGTLASFIPGVGPAIGTGLKAASMFMADGGVVPRDGYQEGGPKLSDEEYAIRTAAAEMSRSADPQEALGIMSTIHNRRQSGEYGNTYRDVVLAPKQFEPWATTNNNPLNIRTEDPRYAAAQEAYRKIQEEGVPEQFKNVYNFWGPKSQEALGREPPSWGRVGGLDIGGTRFHTREEVDQSRGMPRDGGLGGGKLVASAQERPQQQPVETEQKGGLGDYLTSSRFLVPLGTGLLTMASSPSRYLGAAALQGLGAGLAATGVGEETAQRIEKQRLENIGTGLGLVGQSFLTLNGMPHAIMPGNKILSYTEWVKAGRPMPKGGVAAAKELEQAGQQWVQTTGGAAAAPAGGTSAPGKVDIGAPEPPKVQTAQEKLAETKTSYPGATIVVPQASRAVAEAEEMELQNMMPADRETRIAQNTAIQNNALKTQRAAYDMTPQLLDLAIPLSNMEAGQQITPNAWSKIKAFLSGQVNAGVDSLMSDQPLEVRKKYHINPEGLTDYQLAQKAVALIREGKADALGQRAVQSLQVLAEGLADPSKQAGTIRELLAASLMEKQKALEEALFIQDYGKGRTNIVGRDAAVEFSKHNSDRMYYDQAQAMKDLLSKNVNGVPMVSYLTGKGRLDPEMAKRLTPEAINRYYGFDIARFFGRGTP